MYKLFDALRLATKYGHLDIVKFLVQNGANVHANDDWTLRFAAREGHLDIVKYLLHTEHYTKYHTSNKEVLSIIEKEKIRQNQGRKEKNRIIFTLQNFMYLAIIESVIQYQGFRYIENHSHIFLE